MWGGGSQNDDFGITLRPAAETFAQSVFSAAGYIREPTRKKGFLENTTPQGGGVSDRQSSNCDLVCPHFLHFLFGWLSAGAEFKQSGRRFPLLLKSSRCRSALLPDGQATLARVKCSRNTVNELVGIHVNSHFRRGRFQTRRRCKSR